MNNTKRKRSSNTIKKIGVKKSAIENTNDSTVCCEKKSHSSKSENKKRNKEKKCNSNKKFTLPVFISFFIVFLIIIGIAFAFFNYSRNGNENKLIVGKIYMHYNTSNTISMQNVEPRSTLDPNMYIGFTVDGLNEYKEKDIWYAIDLLYGDVPLGKSEENRIRDDLLKFTLTKSIDDSEEEVVIDNVGYPDIQNLRIHVERISKNTITETEHNYKLYVWISDEITVGNNQSYDYTVEEWNNLFASIKVKVTGDFVEKYSTGSVKVNFDANGGSVDIPYMYYVKGETYENLPVPEREDYIFDGWYDDNDTKILSTDIVATDGDVINLQARWTEIPGVAKINNTYYQTLQAAINAVSTNNTETGITLIKDVNECVTVQAKQNIILNLRGNKVQSANNTQIVTNNGTLTIINGTLDGGNITNAVINNNKSGKVIVGNGGRVVATGTGERGAIYNNGGTVEVLEGAYLSSAAKGKAGGRNLPRATINSFNNGVVTITGGTIIGVNQEAISNENSTLTIGVKDGRVNRESPVIMGGTNGVSVLNTSTFNYYDGTIKGKTAGINNTTFITEIEDNYGIITSQEIIDGNTYVEQHLGLGITVIFDPTDGSINESDRTRNIESGDKIGMLPTPTRDGYLFDGWWTHEEGGTQITSETVVMQSTRYYAHWEYIIVAEINGKEYNTVQSALDDIPTDNTEVTITIVRDMTENVTIKPNQNVVLNLQNNKIENSGNNAVITNNGTVEIVSGTVSSNAAAYAAIDNNPNGRVIINGGRIITSGDRSSIYNNGGIVEIKGNSYISSTATGRATNLTLDRATISNMNNGTVIITGGTIVGINQQAISNENATLTIGTKDGSINTSAPTIIGKNYGVVNTGTFKYYDGTLKGITAAISGSITDKETNSEIANGVETIDGNNYKTQYLEPTS